jgi:hypothetical protein
MNDTSLPPSPFTRGQAAEAGIDADDLKRLIASREIRRVLRGVYASADTPDSLTTRCAAARLVTSAHVVICDRTAAWIWGVDVFDYRELEILPPLETWALRGHPRVTREGCAGGTRDLASHDVVEVQGLRVTTPLRTALDLACRLPARSALAALDAFMREHNLTRADYRRGLVRYYRRRGVVQARMLVGLADGRSESAGESWVRLAMLEAGLPEPELQCWVDVDGVPTYRLDIAYPKHKVAVEYDGAAFHDHPADRDRDERRRTWLREHGWTVIVVTRHKLGEQAVRRWTDEVARALGLQG